VTTPKRREISYLFKIAVRAKTTAIKARPSPYVCEQLHRITVKKVKNLSIHVY
jgi:hypothetical protein